MDQEARRTLALSETIERTVRLLVSAPHIFLLITAPILLTQLAQYASGPAFLITIFIPIIVDAALFYAIYVRAMAVSQISSQAISACVSELDP